MRAWAWVAVAVGAAALLFLGWQNPAELPWFPKCPFFALTGYKCPGCGTLRAIHFLLHLNFAEAWRMNPLAVATIPLVGALAAFPKFRRNPLTGWSIFIIVLGHWIFRNAFA